MDLSDFCKLVLADPVVQAHIRWTIERHDAAPGWIEEEHVNRYEIIYHWRGDFVKLDRKSYAMLHQLVCESALPFDFVTLAAVGDDYYIMREDDLTPSSSPSS